MPGDNLQFPAVAVPVVARPDVVVVGGGPAGVAAAVAAGRCGVRAWLVERYGFCGGGTVAGLSGTICGLHAVGPAPRQIVFGFAGEFAAALRARGALGEPLRFGRTWLVPHDPAGWKETADALLAGANVAVRFHTGFLHATEQDGRTTLFFRGPEGFFALQPGAVVDASGDAEVVAALGGATTFGRSGVVQTPTMVFRLGGVDLPRFLSVDASELDERIRTAHRSGAYGLPRHHVYAFPMPNRNELLCNMTRIARPDGSAPNPLDGADLSWAESEGRRQAREYGRFLRDRVPGCERAYLVDTGAQIGVRQSRSIVGVARLRNEDVHAARKWPGAVSHSAWPIELHGAGRDGVSIHYLEQDTYDIPFEALVPERSRCVVAAGRCLSAEHEALASARVTAQCFGMGHAAGAAAALVAREALRADQLGGVQVRAWMGTNGLKASDEP